MALHPSATFGVNHGAGGHERPGVVNPIRLGDYPRLRELAWHLLETAELLPHEALQLYERNWRHVEHMPWTANERALLDTLIGVHGKGHLLVRSRAPSPYRRSPS